MRPLSTGELERLLGVGARTIRRWESANPLLSPKRGESGRRVWAERDLQLLFAIRRLVNGRGLSLEAACEALMAERGGASDEQRITALVAEARAELLRAWTIARDRRERLSRLSPPEPARKAEPRVEGPAAP